MAKLDRDFYGRDTLAVARELLGKYLVRITDGGPIVCRIRETEAYIGKSDKACHAYNCRRTKRTETFFMAPGHAYVYLIYGMHHCLNFVTEPENEPAAVLIRELEPRLGHDLIAQNRFGRTFGELDKARIKNLLNGPGKVCKGLGISLSENAADLTGDRLFVCERMEDLGLSTPRGDSRFKIKRSKRIGIDYAEEAIDFLWRFTIDN